MKRGQEFKEMGEALNMNIELTTKHGKRSHKSSDRDAGASRRKPTFVFLLARPTTTHVRYLLLVPDEALSSTGRRCSSCRFSVFSFIP